MLYQVSYDKATRVALVQADAAAVPAGSEDVGTFAHPDSEAPDSTVIYHGVRSLLYRRSRTNPALPAMFPDNIFDMQNVSIVYGNIIPVTGVTFDGQYAELGTGQTLQLAHTLTPANASDTGVTYTTDNDEIVTVSETGLLTGVSPGLAIVKIHTNFGVFEDRVEVTVN